jgi:hypothetical protein
MSKKKQKTRIDKEFKKHDFSHLTKTKTAAKIVEAEAEVSTDSKSPLDKEIASDLKKSLIIIGIFVVSIVVLWFLFGKNGEIFNLTDKIKLF